MNEVYKKIIERYVQAYNSFNIDGMLENLDDQIVFENSRNGKVDLRIEGLDAFRKQAEAAKQYFEHRKQTIKNWRIDGNTVLIEINYEGLLAMDISDEFKKGATLKLRGTSKFQFENGKIRRISDES